VQKYCWQCHANGGIAQGVVDLSTYTTVKQNSLRMWQAVYNCWMPNVDASPPPRAYPTEQERETIITWADACMAPDN
jgi:hypothetical protein